MKISKVEIERFRGIRSLNFSMPSNIQLVAGANNSGKSTLMSALDFFFSGEVSNIALEFFQPKNRYYKLESPRALTKIKIYFDSLSSSEAIEFEDVISQRSQGFWCQIRITRTGQVSYTCSQGGDAKTVYEKIVSRFSVFHIPVLRVSQDGISDIESERLIKAVSDVLVRNRPGPKSREQKRFESSAKSFKKLIGKVLGEAKTASSNLLPSDSTVQFDFPSNAEILKSVLENIGVQSRPKDGLTLKEEGTGYQSLLALGLLKHVANQETNRRNQNLLILLEEPEAFLHPQYQRLVAKYLDDISERAQIFVSTHSPTIIDATDVQNVMRLERDMAGLQLTWNPEKLSEKSRGNLSRWCDAKNSELIFSSLVILCEGISDVNVIKRIFEFSLESFVSLPDISIISMESKDNGDKFAELVTRFNIPCLFIFDKDVHSGNRTTLKKVVDILGKKFSQNEYNQMNSIAGRENDTLETNNSNRDAINKILMRRNIFTLSSDIEGALATSYPRRTVSKFLEELSLVDTSGIESLREQQGYDYYKKLFRLIGSKGWENTKSKSKIKPHQTSAIIDHSGVDFSPKSDLHELRKVMREFVTKYNKR